MTSRVFYATTCAALFAVGVAACSSGTEPVSSGGPGPTASVEQPYTPTAEPIVVAEDLLPAWWAEAGDVFPAEYGIPAAYAPDYVFSDTPRGAHEQWIFDNYPQYWEAGVRALSPVIEMWPWGWNGKIDYERNADGWIVLYDENGVESPDGKPRALNLPEAGPAVLVQYYNGTRYDGTPALPLVFGSRDPLADPGDVNGDSLRLFYLVSLSVSGSMSRGVRLNSPSHTEAERGAFETKINGAGSVRVGTLDEALALAGSGEYLSDGEDVPAGQWRALLPGEVIITIHHDDFGIDIGRYNHDSGMVDLYSRSNGSLVRSVGPGES